MSYTTSALVIEYGCDLYSATSSDRSTLNTDELWHTQRQLCLSTSSVLHCTLRVSLLRLLRVNRPHHRDDMCYVPVYSTYTLCSVSGPRIIGYHLVDRSHAQCTVCKLSLTWMLT